VTGGTATGDAATGDAATGDPRRIRVALGQRGYDVVVGTGLLSAAGEFLAPVLRGRRAVVVADETVAALHLPTLAASLDAAGFRHDTVVVPPGEASKSFAQLERLLDAILDLAPERTTAVVALGGGVVGDLAGFAASVLLRGVDLVQAPTTLLAQVDSSVGGKTGIDTRHGKNLVGSFHQPRLVLADIAALDTLPPRELRAGYAEIVKYGLIDDPGFFAWLEHQGRAVLDGDRPARAEAVARSCAAKARIVAADEREEAGARALLNLGHTFAHALEAETGFGADLLHGEAVALGTVLAFDLSARLGLCPPGDAERVRRHLADAGLPVSLRQISLPERSADRLLARMARDKKVRDGRLVLVLARGIGAAFVDAEADPGRVRDFLAERLAA
jgi:3-dehydroquinate synthase